MKEREEAIRAEMTKHGIDAVYWPGIRGGQKPIDNINRSHKMLVRFAKENNLPSILIGEDDLRFFGESGEAFKYFLTNRPTEPYDIFLSSYYQRDKKIEGLRLTNFAGLTLYEVMQPYYDTFLSIPDTGHIDRRICMTGAKIFVCDKFCTFQSPGYSFQRRQVVDDNYMLEKHPKFGE